MEFDVLTILCILLSILIGAVIFKFFKDVDQNTIDKIFDKMKVIMEGYGPMLEQENPELYAKVQTALSIHRWNRIRFGSLGDFRIFLSCIQGIDRIRQEQGINPFPVACSIMSHS